VVPAGDRIRAVVGLSTDRDTRQAPAIVLPAIHPEVRLKADTTEY